MENPAVSLRDPEAWDEAFGSTGSTEAGIQVTHAGALDYSPVWQAVALLSGDVAALPLEVFRRLDGGDREPDKRHTAYDRIRWQANEETHAFDFWRTVMVHALLWNNAYVHARHRANGEIEGLYHLLPDRTAPVRVPGKALFYATEIGGKLKTAKASSVYHLKGISIDGSAGHDMVTSARNAIALGLAAEKFGSKFFKNGARASGILQTPAGLKNEKAVERFKKSFDSEYASLDNVAKTILLEDGAKFHATTIKPEEGQFLQTRQEQVRDVARFFNVPAHKLGDSTKTSYSSLEQSNQDYLDSSLVPWLVPIQMECRAKLLSPAERRADSHFFEHNVKARLRADVVARATAYRIFREIGVSNGDDIARAENMRPIPEAEGGKTYFVPSNWMPQGAPAVPAGMTNTEPPNDEGDDAGRQSEAAAGYAAGILVAHRGLLIEAVGRSVRRLAVKAKRAAAHPAKYAEFVERLRAEFERLDGGPHDNCQDDVAVAIGPAVRAVCAVLGCEPAERLPAVRAAVLDVVARYLDAAMDATPENLARAVDMACQRMEHDAARAAADVLITETTTYSEVA